MREGEIIRNKESTKCLLVCLLVCLFACLLVCLFACLLVCFEGVSLITNNIHSLKGWYVFRYLFINYYDVHYLPNYV